MSPTDQEIIADYLRGHLAAIDVLVERYTKPIYSFLYRQIGNSTEAEDLTQETFVKMWRTLKRYRPTESFKTWLYTIARNTAIDWLRKKKHLHFSDFDTADGDNVILDTLRDDAPLPDELMELTERRELLEQLLQELSPASREVMQLHYEGQFTFEEISRIVKKPMNTVKSLHQRALQTLRDAHAPKIDPHP